MALTFNKRVWVLAERLQLDCYEPEVFLRLLQRHDLDYPGEVYERFYTTKGWYTFMSEADSTFASFMELIPIYKYLPDCFGDIFLDYIRKEINAGYKNHSYFSVMFLSRKILEVIVVRIFEVVFPKLKNRTYSSNNHQLWYNIDHGRYHNFETLLDNLKLKAKDFHKNQELVFEFISLVRPFKDEILWNQPQKLSS